METMETELSKEVSEKRTDSDELVVVGGQYKDWKGFNE